MNSITLRVLHLIRGCLNYDGKWQTDKEAQGD